MDIYIHTCIYVEMLYKLLSTAHISKVSLISQQSFSFFLSTCRFSYIYHIKLSMTYKNHLIQRC